MYTSIADNLTLTLSEIHQHLRLDPEFETILSASSEPGALSHAFESVDGLRAHTYITIGGVDAKITYIDVGNRIVVLDRVVTPLALTAGTIVTYHFQNTMLIDFAEAAKSMLDNYLDNPFYVNVFDPVNMVMVKTIRIPAEIRVWVLNQIAYWYIHPENSVSSRSQREQGSMVFNKDMFEGVNHLKLFFLG